MEPKVITSSQKQIPIRNIANIASRGTFMLEDVREKMLAPDPGKEPPSYTTSAVAQLCRTDKTKLPYLINKYALPAGSAQGNGRTKYFTLAETRQIVKQLGPFEQRPQGELGRIYAVGNFKGGVTKTTTVKCLGQDLSLKGRNVLLFDLDPQGSLTTLCGIIPATEVSEEQTALPAFYHHSEKLAAVQEYAEKLSNYPELAGLSTGQKKTEIEKRKQAFADNFDLEHHDLKYAIRPTYWDGIDLIPAHSSLFAAEFILPSVQLRDPTFKFWDVLNQALQPLREIYDVILIDTPPALSYVTINAFLAADGLIIPTPPNALDFASSTQFWTLFHELVENMDVDDKYYDFLFVLLAKVDKTQAATPIVSDWIRTTYQEMVLPVEIPSTTVSQTASAEFGTVYDITKYDGSAKTYQRARNAYDQFGDLIDQQLTLAWSRGKA